MPNQHTNKRLDAIKKATTETLMSEVMQPIINMSDELRMEVNQVLYRAQSRRAVVEAAITSFNRELQDLILVIEACEGLVSKIEEKSA